MQVNNFKILSLILLIYSQCFTVFRVRFYIDRFFKKKKKVSYILHFYKKYLQF